MKHIDLEQFANGALSTQINRAMEIVAQNIQDPNTDATAVRKVNVTITLKPNELRDFVTTGVTTKNTLAPELGAVTAMTMGKNLKTGEVEALEIGNQIPGQMSMDNMAEDAEEPVVMTKTVDPSTGEVYEVPVHNQVISKVVDLRAAKEA